MTAIRMTGLDEFISSTAALAQQSTHAKAFDAGLDRTARSFADDANRRVHSALDNPDPADRQPFTIEHVGQPDGAGVRVVAQGRTGDMIERMESGTRIDPSLLTDDAGIRSYNRRAGVARLSGSGMAPGVYERATDGGVSPIALQVKDGKWNRPLDFDADRSAAARRITGDLEKAWNAMLDARLR